MLLTITEMLNVTNINQHAVLSAHKINHKYFATSVNVPLVYFIGTCTNLTRGCKYEIILCHKLGDIACKNIDLYNNKRYTLFNGISRHFEIVHDKTKQKSRYFEEKVGKIG